jgi:hypothetical protein
MISQRIIRLAVTCGQCGHRTSLAPAPYVESEVISLLCAGCETLLAVVLTLPGAETEEPAWYRDIDQV